MLSRHLMNTIYSTITSVVTFYSPHIPKLSAYALNINRGRGTISTGISVRTGVLSIDLPVDHRSTDRAVSPYWPIDRVNRYIIHAISCGQNHRQKIYRISGVLSFALTARSGGLGYSYSSAVVSRYLHVVLAGETESSACNGMQ